MRVHLTLLALCTLVAATIAGSVATSSLAATTIFEAGDLRLVEGMTQTVQVARFSADDPMPQNVADYSATIGWGDGTTSTGVISVDATFPNVYSVTGTHLYRNIIGSDYQDFVLTVIVSDAVDSTVETRVVGAEGLPPGVRVLNAVETWTGRPSQVLDAVEGSEFTGILASLVDANPYGTAADYAADIYWSDPPDSGEQPREPASFAPNATGGVDVIGTHTFQTPGSYPVTIFHHLVGHSLALSGGSVEVRDAPLTAQGTALRFANGKDFQDVTVATFTDADPTPTLTDDSALIDWGDGTTSPGTIVDSGASFAVVGSHTYRKPGSYTINTVITSQYGSTATATTTVSKGKKQ
jgi:large repetitive protein